jgi:hypothetical protein
MAHIEIRANGGSSFVGATAVSIYRATAFEVALRAYARSGIRVNRLWTPKNMMAVAAEITGLKFKTREYEKAADALRAWRTDPANVPPVETRMVCSNTIKES